MHARLDPLFAPGRGVVRALDNYGPAFHTFGANHDRLVGYLTGAGVPDLIANVPTMSMVYMLSIYQEVGGLLFRGTQLMQTGMTGGPSPFDHTAPR